MKIIEKTSLVIFANLILILSIIMILITFGWIEVEAVQACLSFLQDKPVASNITLVICILLILLALKCIFFDSSSKENKASEGITLQNENGKLLISKDTIENLATSVVKGFESAENTVSKVRIDKENNVILDIMIQVEPNAVIKDLSNNLQMKIKETIKNSLDLDIKEVNIRIKDITPKKTIIEE